MGNVTVGRAIRDGNSGWRCTSDPKEREKLAGTWIAASALDYGVEVPEEEAKLIQLTLTEAEFTAVHGGKTVMKGTSTLTRKRSPRP
jgi:hypothetical protein